MIALAALALLVQLDSTQRARVAWVPNPRTASSSWISDASRHLRPATIDSVNAIIGALERETTSEIAVAVVDSMSGLEAQEFATALHRHWGVGKAGKDNGVLLLWNPVHRDIYISTGYGLEGAIPDRRAGRIRDEIIAEFRQQRFDEGILAGVTALAAAAREETGGRQGLSRALDDGRPSRARTVLTRVGGVVGGVLAICAGIFGMIRWRRFRPRKCSNGHPMRRLDEKKDDDYLEQGAKAEERLRSIDWDVWVCAQCDEVMRVPYKSWTSGYSDCPKCKRKTKNETTKTLVAATTTHGGSEQVIEHCGNCGYRSESTRSTPMIVHSTSSSSSGGSFSSGGGSSGGGSFGGGSAGGGGAGGRY